MRTEQDIFEYSSTPVTRRIVRKGMTANWTAKMPGGFRLTGIYIRNNSANAVTGGIRIGSAAAGTQHLTAQAVAANGVYYAVPTVIAPIVQTAGELFVEAVTAWNSANLDFVIEYEEILQPTLEETVNGVALYDPLGRH